MFISRITYNMPNAIAYLNDDLTAYSLHQDMWTFFPGIDKNSVGPFLYAVVNPKVLMVSKIQPVCPNSLWTLETRPYDPVFDQGQGLMFDLNFCPTFDLDGKKRSYLGYFLKTLNEEEGTRGEKVHALLQEWFDRRIERFGFKVKGFEVTKDINRTIPKPGQPYKFNEVSVSGVLEVLDVDKVRHTIFTGIGREKRNGCGLLLVS